MIQYSALREVADLTDPRQNVIFNMTVDEARGIVAAGDADAVRRIDGHFALVGVSGHLVRLVRSLAVPMRYFIAKRADGPAMVVAHRIDEIRDWLAERGLSEQFHPSYTRMVPAHYITEVALVGCPDPNPVYRRYFAPQRECLPPDIDTIGRRYIGALADEIRKWLNRIDRTEPIGICFSGGIDSGSVFLVTYYVMLETGMNPARLKAFTLSIDGGGDDLAQARKFLSAMRLDLFLEPIEASAADIQVEDAVRVMEDYKPLDVQAGAMTLALARGIRRRDPAWKHLIDGDGGDENLKDYPIEANPELTIRSVLNNRMLYQEGWGVDAIKHSLTYSGGLSRGCTRGFAPLRELGFEGFSPYMLPNVIEVAEGIPFAALTDWQHGKLYDLKGRVVQSGVRAITGLDMPVFEKRRFQEGAMQAETFADRFDPDPLAYRRAFHAVCHA